MDYHEIQYVRYSVQFADISSDNSDTDAHSFVSRHDCALCEDEEIAEHRVSCN